MTRLGPSLVHASAWLAILAGIFLLYQGLKTLGWRPRRKRASETAPDCLVAPIFASLLHRPGTLHVFLAGLATGFLPCGLLYGMLALAASTHHLGIGAAVMAVFGLGTAPALVLAGTGGRLLSAPFRRKLYFVAAWCVVLTGVVAIGRGAAFLTWAPETTACPFCSDQGG